MEAVIVFFLILPIVALALFVGFMIGVMVERAAIEKKYYLTLKKVEN